MFPYINIKSRFFLGFSLLIFQSYKIHNYQKREERKEGEERKEKREQNYKL